MINQEQKSENLKTQTENTNEKIENPQSAIRNPQFGHYFFSFVEPPASDASAVRCVVFGKLGEFAATLKKGAHIQVEGELRSRKYDSKKTNSEQTIWEIRVNSILKLDRAAKVAPEDEDSTEEEAA